MHLVALELQPRLYLVGHGTKVDQDVAAAYIPKKAKHLAPKF